MTKQTKQTTQASQKAESTDYNRNKLISKLTEIPHGELGAFIEVGLQAAINEPDFYGHFLTWNRKTKVRDQKIAFPVLALRGLERLDANRDLAENAIAHILCLPPTFMVRAYEFYKQVPGRLGGGWRKLLESSMAEWLKLLQGDFRRWDVTTVQHRGAIRKLYRLTHIHQTDRVGALLFNDRDQVSGLKDRYARYSRSKLAVVARLKDLTPGEAATSILVNKIPFEVAIGSVAKAKDHAIVLALLEGMTGNQLMNSTKMLKRLGVFENPILKSAYDAALVRARGDKKLNVLKAEVAARAIADDADEDDGAADLVVAKLMNLQRTTTEQLGSIEGDWAVFGDCSGSMSAAVDMARQIAALVAERVSGKVHLIFVNHEPKHFDATGKSYDQIKDMTARVKGEGGTALGCGLEYLREQKQRLDGLVLISDGGDRGTPWFHEEYPKYCRAMDCEPTPYFIQLTGSDGPYILEYCKNAGVRLELRDLRNSNPDYYSLGQLVSTLKVGRYTLLAEVMASPLLTINDVLKPAKKLPA